MRQHSSRIMLKLGKQDTDEYRKKKQGFKVFMEAFESFQEDGLHGKELQKKALSQYTNWAALESDKPREFSMSKLPFYRSTIQEDKRGSTMQTR